MGRGVGYGTVTDTFTYNAREWVTGIDYAGTFASTLTYDLAGNVTRQVYSHGSAASKTADYAFDNLYRITGFDLTGGTSRDYDYDRSGNIPSVVTGGSTLTYNCNASQTPNRLSVVFGTGINTRRYAYNRNGWTTSDGSTSLTYDYRGLTTGVGTAAYLMDPDRRRVKKAAGTAVTYYLRGAVTAAYDYWPYGGILASSGAGATHFRFRFTGHERDAESGLDYMLERSYAYEVGRFLRPDPMQDEYPGISPYAYANNNPLKYVDPDGRAFETVWDVVNIGIGAASLAQNNREGSYGWAALDAVGLVVDVAAAVTPGVPGGAGTLIKAIRGARSADQGADVADAARNAIHGNSKLSPKPQHRYEI